MSKKIVVIGAGISGLTTAYLLSKKGCDVKILEKRDAVGGSIESVMVEAAFAIKRAGADMFLTYFAKDLAKWISANG